MKTGVLTQYTPREEFWNCFIHGTGIAFSFAAMIVLIVFSSIYKDVWAVVSTIVFGMSMTVLYTASTLYHAFRNEEIKKQLKKLDHISIYYLIAGTYTPFLLVNLRESIGWVLFAIIWGLAMLGTILKLSTPVNGTKLWSISLYLLMGWLIVFASKNLITDIPQIGLKFLILGGLFYTFGILFYIWKSKHYTHTVWHLFVLSGTVMHFFAVLYSCVLV